MATNRHPITNIRLEAIVMMVNDPWEDYELLLKKDERIFVIAMDVDGLWKGENLSGRSGWFPANCVKILRTATVKTAHYPWNDDELALTEQQKIVILEKRGNKEWKGEDRHGRTGWFPAYCVTEDAISLPATKSSQGLLLDNNGVKNYNVARRVEMDKLRHRADISRQKNLLGPSYCVMRPTSKSRVIIDSVGFWQQNGSGLLYSYGPPIRRSAPCDSEVTFTATEGMAYKINFRFRVQRQLVLGLQYQHSVRRCGIIVEKETVMIGTYGPNFETRVVNSGLRVLPTGFLTRGEYKVKSKIFDDDGYVYLDWNWTFHIVADTSESSD